MEDPIKVKAQKRRHYLKNKERLKAKSHAYYWQNREKILARYRTPEVRAKKKIVTDKWRDEHPENVKAWKQREYQKNKTRSYLAAKKWRLNHPERAAEFGNKWRLKNQDKVNDMAHRRRTRMKLAYSEDCSERIQYLRMQKNCHWCNRGITPDTVSIDHVIPLCKGGSHIVSNLVASCLPCNWSKGSKMPNEWQPVTTTEVVT